MVQQESILRVADNTGAKTVLVIRNMSSRSRMAVIGDIIFGTIKSASPSGNLKKGEKVRAVVIRSKHPIRRANGTTIKFGENAVAIINAQNQPVGTRIFGAVPSELKLKKFDKIVSLVSEVL